MKTKHKLIWLTVVFVILFIDYEFLLPIFGMVLKYFMAMLFAVCGPIIAAFFIIRSFFIKAPKVTNENL